MACSPDLREQANNGGAQQWDHKSRDESRSFRVDFGRQELLPKVADLPLEICIRTPVHSGFPL